MNIRHSTRLRLRSSIAKANGTSRLRRPCQKEAPSSTGRHGASPISSGGDSPASSTSRASAKLWPGTFVATASSPELSSPIRRRLGERARMGTSGWSSTASPRTAMTGPGWLCACCASTTLLIPARRNWMRRRSAGVCDQMRAGVGPTTQSAGSCSDAVSGSVGSLAVADGEGGGARGATVETTLAAGRTGRSVRLRTRFGLGLPGAGAMSMSSSCFAMAQE